MGITNFFTWFKQHFDDAVKTYSSMAKVKLSCTTVAIDLNGVFHTVMESIQTHFLSDTEDVFPIARYLRLVEKCIDTIVDTLEPTKHIILCIDGVAGAAKSQTQRKRRDKSNPNSMSLQITPGTKLMYALSSYLDFICRIRKHKGGKWEGLDIILSTERHAGEGEHLMIRLAEQVTIATDSVALYSADTDVVLLGLISSLPNAFIVRPRVGIYNNALSIVDIEKVKLKLTPVVSIQDFVFMISLMGNDFVPLVRGGLSNAGKIFIACQEPIIDPHTLSMNTFNFQNTLKRLLVSDRCRCKINPRQVLDYIITMHWILQYYAINIPSWSWSFNHEAPCIYCLHATSKRLREHRQTIRFMFSLDSPLSVFGQILSLYPQRCYPHLLPLSLHSLDIRDDKTNCMVQYNNLIHDVPECDRVRDDPEEGARFYTTITTPNLFHCIIGSIPECGVSFQVLSISESQLPPSFYDLDANGPGIVLTETASTESVSQESSSHCLTHQ